MSLMMMTLSRVTTKLLEVNENQKQKEESARDVYEKWKFCTKKLNWTPRYDEEFTLLAW